MPGVDGGRRRKQAVPLALLLACLCAGTAVLAGPTAAPAGALSASQAASGAPDLAQLRALEDRGRVDPVPAIQALQALRLRTAAGSAQRLELLSLLGLLYARQSDAAHAEAIANELADWADGGPVAAPLAKSASLGVRAELASNSDADLAHAEQLAGEALQLLPAEPAPAYGRERLRLLGLLSSVQIQRGRLDASVLTAQEQVRIADALGDLVSRSRTRDNLSYALLRAGQTEGANRLNAEARALADRAGDPAQAANARVTLSILLGQLGDHAGERAAMQDALKLARQAGWLSQEALLLANLADSFLKTREFQTARDYAEQALALLANAPDRYAQSGALTNLGLAELGLKRVDAGRQHLEQALSIERRRGARAEEAAILSDMGEALEQAGQPAQAIAAYHRLRELQEEILQGDRQRAVLELQERFDAERRQHELTLLQREGELRDAQLQAQGLKLRLGLLAVLASALGAAVVVLLVQRTRRVNRELANANALLRIEGGRDALTGLANRRRVQEVMQRRGSVDGTLLLVDLDHFKHINDTAGHAAGDAALLQVAQRLREALREADLLARWGGEEFLIFLPGMAEDQVEPLVKRLLQSIGGAPVAVAAAANAKREQAQFGLSASIGYASFPLLPAHVALPWEAALNLVDAALYLAKAKGRNRACGVRLLQAHDAAGVADLRQRLEQANEAGYVALAWTQGPEPEGALA